MKIERATMLRVLQEETSTYLHKSA
jgi:hypothetical protein